MREKRPPVPGSKLRGGYRRMSENESREREALEWADATAAEPRPPGSGLALRLSRSDKPKAKCQT
jgi:hypothetical protein